MKDSISQEELLKLKISKTLEIPAEKKKMAEEELIEEVDNVIKNIVTEEYPIGEGKTALVFAVEQEKEGVIFPSTFCYKIIKSNFGLSKHRAKGEMEILDAAFELNRDMRSVLSKIESEKQAQYRRECFEKKQKQDLQKTFLLNKNSAMDFAFSPMPLAVVDGIKKELFDGIKKTDDKKFFNDGVDFLFMKRIKGLSIKDFLKKISELSSLISQEKYDEFNQKIKEGDLSVEFLKWFFDENNEGFEIFKHVLEIMVEKMHEKNIYHRDLHNGNIMIDFKTGLPTIIDFGEGDLGVFETEEDSPYRYETEKKNENGKMQKITIFCNKTDEQNAENVLTELEDCVINNKQIFANIFTSK